MSEKEILTDRLSDIAERLVALEIALANCPRDGSYERQELETEKNELLVQRRATERALTDLNAPAPPPNEDQRRSQRSRKKFIANEVANRREDTLAWIEKLTSPAVARRTDRTARASRERISRLKETTNDPGKTTTHPREN